MIRAIGSVMPLPEAEAGPPSVGSLWATWIADHHYASAYRSARGALAGLLRFRQVERVWLPAYACAALAEGVEQRERLWFGVDDSLEPDVATLAEGLRKGDAVVAVDYFGRAPGPGFLTLVESRPDVLWIEDRAQALDPGSAPWAQVVLYSPRKLIGVGDGGLLIGDDPLPAPRGEPALDDAAAQTARRADPDGCRPETWFPLFQAQEQAFGPDDAPMSQRTRRILQRVDAPPLVERRKSNAAFLGDRLADLALWPGMAFDFAPLAFPIRIQDARGVAAALAADGIYCARHWRELPSDPERFPAAHGLAAEMLSLPCDHRYTDADMARIVAKLRAFQARGAR